MALKTRYSPLQRLTLDNLLTAFSDLSPSRKILAVGVVAVLMILVLFLPLSLLSGKISSLKREISNAQKGYLQVADKLVEYQKVKAETDALDKRFGRGGGGALSTRIENAAKQSDLTVDQVKERAPIETDYLEINSIDVTLRNIDLQSLLDFLYNLENDRMAPMRVRRIRIKPRYRNRQKMDVSFEAATFSIKKEI